MKIISFLLLVLFFSLEYYFVESLNFFEGRGLYLFEVFFILSSFIFFKNQFQFKSIRLKEWAIIGFTSTLMGLIMAIACKAFGILIPFDLKRPEGIVMLLFLGPILEEFLYRFSLWNFFKIYLKQDFLLVLVIAVVFSFGHFYPYFSAPGIYYQFIIFQTIYTFFLSLVIGQDWVLNRNFLRLVLIHIFFNMGFFLGVIS
ncbi:MAG: type II CAAX prenyl endopeptidase Rce1 family protein [Bacteriovoracaceae bacterium]